MCDRLICVGRWGNYDVPKWGGGGGAAHRVSPSEVGTAVCCTAAVVGAQSVSAYVPVVCATAVICDLIRRDIGRLAELVTNKKI